MPSSLWLPVLPKHLIEDEPLHWEPGLLRRIKWSVPVPALWVTQSETGEKGDNDNERESRNARSEAQAGLAVGITAPTAPVRGDFRRRPWLVPPPSVARAAPEPGAHGRIADGGGPKTRLGTHNRKLGAYDSNRRIGL